MLNMYLQIGQDSLFANFPPFFINNQRYLKPISRAWFIPLPVGGGNKHLWSVNFHWIIRCQQPRRQPPLNLRDFLALGPNGKTILGPREGKFGPPSFNQFPGWEFEELSRQIKCSVDFLES
jgi:hypothetical protein